MERERETVRARIVYCSGFLMRFYGLRVRRGTRPRVMSGVYSSVVPCVVTIKSSHNRHSPPPPTLPSSHHPPLDEDNFNNENKGKGKPLLPSCTTRKLTRARVHTHTHTHRECTHTKKFSVDDRALDRVLPTQLVVHVLVCASQ